MLTSYSDRHRFSQRLIDAVSSATGKEESFDAEDIRPALPAYLADILFSHDRDAERMMEDRGQRRQIFFVSCEEIVENEAVMEDMRSILKMLQSAYRNPVDVEFTINISPSREYVIDILQCRPLQTTSGDQKVTIPPKKSFDKILLETKGVSMGFSRSFPVDVLVYIDAVAYYEMPYNEKYDVKSALSAVNWKLRGKNKRMVLIAPGRICTSSPELGVPSAFSDISEFDAIVEVSEANAGFMPEHLAGFLEGSIGFREIRHSRSAGVVTARPAFRLEEVAGTANADRAGQILVSANDHQDFVHPCVASDSLAGQFETFRIVPADESADAHVSPETAATPLVAFRCGYGGDPSATWRSE